MKKAALCISAVVAMAACNTTEEHNVTKVDTVAENAAASNTISLPGKMCFQFIQQRDTVNIQLFIKDNAVYGNLAYNMFEKDDNKGTFKGNIKDNIIKADYTYASEGITSVREVIFQLKDSTLTEGFADIEEKGNKFVFKDSTKVQFTQVYKTIDCP